MTATATTTTDALVARLVALRAERDHLLAESLRESTGDIADRATNVEATIRLALIDERIATLEIDIEESRAHPAHRRRRVRRRHGGARLR